MLAMQLMMLQLTQSLYLLEAQFHGLSRTGSRTSTLLLKTMNIAITNAKSTSISF